MKNKMQKLYLAPQISADTQEPVFFNVYENETVVDKATGEEITRGTARVIFAYKTRKVNVFTKSSTSKTVRATHNFPLDNVEDVSEIIDFLQDAFDPDGVLPKNFFTNQDVVSNFIETNEKLFIKVPAKIVTQEFAFKLLRYKAGNTADCLKSYVAALSTNKTHTYTDSKGVERTVDTPAFASKITNVIKRAVRKVNPKLLVECADTTGKFSFTLLGARDLKELSAIMKHADEILFGTAKNLDGILKRPRKGAPALQTTDGKYILSDNFFVDDESFFDSAPEIKVEHDSENASFVKYQNETRAARVLASIVENESEDEEDDDEETVGADASFETGEE